MDRRYDAAVVGAGPNGLAAAITLATAGRSVVVLEAAPTPGGGCRTAELTLPGFRHDVCAAVHPLAASSPWFRSVPLASHGLRLVPPEVALAHPLDGGRAAVLHRSVETTMSGLGVDGPRWRQVVGWVAEHWDVLAPAVMGPMLRPPRHPLALAGFGVRGLAPSTWMARAFATEETRALLGGCAAHSFLRLEHAFTSSLALMLAASAHVADWPVAEGGSGAIVKAMVSLLTELGGEIRVDHTVRSMAEIPRARAVLFDLTPRQVRAIAADRLSPQERAAFDRYHYGPGVWKVDYALSGPVPWTNADCRRAGTVHVGGSIGEIAAAETAVARGQHPERPFVLVGQQSLADPTRAPIGQHTLWAYCHVPNGSDRNMTGAIEAQLERFAPGFTDTILARHEAGPRWFEDYNANDVGGDINGGSVAGTQLLLRPTPTLHPYRLSDPALFLCSAATPPGGGVHGMCGMRAAQAALSGPLR